MTTERDVHELAGQLAQAAKLGAQPERQGLNASKPFEVSTAIWSSSPHLNHMSLVQQAVHALQCIHRKDVMTQQQGICSVLLDFDARSQLPSVATNAAITPSCTCTLCADLRPQTNATCLLLTAGIY